MALLRRHKADKPQRSRRRVIRRLVAFGTAVAGLLAWRERQMSRNAEQASP